jgi:hypothetical protein
MDSDNEKQAFTLYSEQYKDPRWQKKRLEIMQRSNYSCEWCGNTKKQLSIHHGYYKPKTAVWEYDNSTLHCLCQSCHEFAGELLGAVHYFLAASTYKQLQQIVGYTVGVVAPEVCFPLDWAEFECGFKQSGAEHAMPPTEQKENEGVGW